MKELHYCKVLKNRPKIVKIAILYLDFWLNSFKIERSSLRSQSCKNETFLWIFEQCVAVLNLKKVDSTSVPFLIQIGNKGSTNPFEGIITHFFTLGPLH